MLRRAFLPVLALLLLLAGCVLPGGPGAAPETTGADAAPLAAEAIAVTPLESAPAADPATTAPAAAAPAAAAPAAPADAAKAAPAPAEAAKPNAAKAGGEAPAPGAAEEDPVPPKPPEQLACEKNGGTWATTGTSGAQACVRRTRDGGKQCSNGRQCEGDCLARSRSCSPIAPLFGCNEILQDNGARVNQCLE